MIGALPPPNKPHWSMYEYVAFRLISPCKLSASFYLVRMLMLIGPLSLPNFTIDGRLSKMANFCVSHC